MNNIKYDIIFFDADETLFDYKRSEKDSFKKTLIELFRIKNIKAQKIYERYSLINEKLWDKYHQNIISKKEVLDTRFFILFNEIKMKVDLILFNKIYMENLSNSHYLMPNAIETLSQLSKYCTLGLITNGVASVQRKRIKNSPLKHFLKTITVSGDIKDEKFSKPNKLIFNYAHKKIDLKIKHSRILMVGDNLISDIKGGINYNIHTCWFNPFCKINSTSIKPTYETSSLLELIKIVNY